MGSLRDLDQFIELNGLEHIGELLRSRVRTCYHMFHDPHVGDEPGSSRLGGLPDLPAGTAWPVSDEQLPEFIAQLDLEQISREHGASALPSSGLLSIFAVTAHDPVRRPALAVYTPAGVPLARVPAPAGVRVFKSVPVRLAPAITLPIEEELFKLELEKLAPALEYGDIRAATWGGRDSLAQILGHPVTFGDDQLSQVALDALGHPKAARLLIWESWEKWLEAKQIASTLANGFVYRPWVEDDDDEMRWVLENRDRIAREIEQWQVLFKLKSNPEMDFWINDADDLYVFIRNDDLAAGRFTRLSTGETQS